MQDFKSKPSVDDLLDSALDAADERRLEVAEDLCRQILAREPRHFDATLLLGVVVGESGRRALGITVLEAAIALQPQSVDAHLQLAGLLRAEGRLADALTVLDEAIRLEPNNFAAHNDSGVVHLEAKQYPEAVARFERVLQLNRDIATARHNLARALFYAGRLADAEQCLNHAIPLAPTNGELHWLLGSALKQLGRFDEAIACFERAIAVDARGVASYYALTTGKKLTEADRPLIERMSALLAGDGLDDEQRTPLHFALGKAYDDLGSYEAAISHYDHANRLKHGTIDFDRERLAKFVDQSIAIFTRDFVARSAAAGSASELPVLVVGMARSGTTLVEQIVSSHPDVGAGGELAYWSEATTGIERIARAGLDPDLMARLAGGYLSVLQRIAPQAKRVSDKMPENFLFVGMIHAVFPKARIIHCRRHPVDTALSIYFTNFEQGNQFAYDRDDIAFYYGQYARLMDHWRQVMPPDNFFEIDYENLIAERERVTRGLIDFCGLDWNPACLRHEDNRRVVKTASVWQARQPIYQSSVARWRNYEPWLGDLRRLLPVAEARLSRQ